MTDFDKIKEYLTDKYNEFNDVEDTKSMEIIADVFYFVEHVEAQSLVMGDDINSQIQEKFMNLVTEHVAQKGSLTRKTDLHILVRYSPSDQ